MMIIADCGATTIDWARIDRKGNISFRKNSGINFSLTPTSEYEMKIKSSIPIDFMSDTINDICFYAAGCRTEEQRSAIAAALQKFFPEAEIDVNNDLLGAARALFGNSPGVACIIGTGSNACLYSPESGGQITNSVPPLGYILGDEGSGTFIGKRIISDALKGLLSSKLTASFFEFAGTDKDGILSRVYEETDANRYIASFAMFARENRQSSEIQNIIYQSFDCFVKRNVMQLIKKSPLPVGFVGSIAHSFQHVLRKVMDDNRLEVSIVLQSPIEALANYHINYLK